MLEEQKKKTEEKVKKREEVVEERQERFRGKKAARKARYAGYG